jgi:bifunctional non-homologous end joining protein LigD
VEVSNADRIIFPEAELTKGDVVAHYEKVADRFLGFAAGRPLTLERFPKGIGGKGFMQKNAAEYFPDTIARFAVPKRSGGDTNYPVIERREDLAYLANQGTLTFHTWLSLASTHHSPDWLIIDLDPEAGDLDGVRFATLTIRDLLSEFGIESFPVATGSKGFHVWVPLVGGIDIGETSQAARALAGLATSRFPDRLTTEFLKKDRKGRVFIDWLRNGQISTVVVPFSLRPRANAPVAVPLWWEEVASARPDQWTLTDLGDRLDVDSAPSSQVVPVAEIVEAAIAAGVDIDSPHDRFGR